jgi:hypothetical protein
VLLLITASRYTSEFTNGRHWAFVAAVAATLAAFAVAGYRQLQAGAAGAPAAAISEPAP